MVHFRKRSVTETKKKFCIGNDVLETVSEYKYLGVNLNYCLDIDATAGMLAGAGSRALGCIISRTKSMYDLGFGSYSKLITSCVNPILDYGSGAWHIGQRVPKIDQVQQRAARFYYGLPKMCPVLALNGETGWCPGVVRRDIESLRLFNQLVQMPEHRLTRRIYEFEKRMHGQWFMNVSEILENIGMEHAIQENITVNVNDAKTELLKMYNEVWHNEVSKSRKLENYLKLKTEPQASPYLLVNVPKNKRALLSQLVAGVLLLEVETGHFYNTPLND